VREEGYTARHWSRVVAAVSSMRADERGEKLFKEDKL
jgi:hypothetical protein